MLGWELPPLITGGLGIACQGLYRALKEEGIEVTFVAPWTVEGVTSDSPDIIGAFGTVRPGTMSGQFLSINALSYSSNAGGGLYNAEINEYVWRFADVVRRIAAENSFDIIHAHDWTTCRAGIAARQVSGKPLVVQFHSIEYDRVLDTPNPAVCALEKEAVYTADRVIVVSKYSRQQITAHYGIGFNKIYIVYNGANNDDYLSPRFDLHNRWPRTVLFVGRLTAQKGPQYFLMAAAEVLKSEPETRFIVAGDGDMCGYLEEMAVELGINRNVSFTGFLSRFDLDRVYSLANVCMITSVSEPFGIVGLEAARRGIPIVVPSQSGVAEVIKSCVRVNPGDTHYLAKVILDIINNRNSIADDHVKNAADEVRNLTWNTAAQRTMKIYQELAVFG